MPGKRLSDKQIKQFREDGYITGLPVFDVSEIEDLNAGLAELCKLLRPGESTKEIREWHEASRWLYDLCTDARILDYVEDILGPDFFLWGSNYFIKEPHSPETVAWHQDSYYWPLRPIKSLTVWLACLDSFVENGAMQVIPGSHKAGLLKHAQAQKDATNSVLTLECEGGQFAEDSAQTLTLKAGQISIHDDKIVHGSQGNTSDRRRVGLTIRYSPTEVKCDLSVNPNFKAYLCRGVDTFGHNPAGEIPRRKFARVEHEHLNIENKGEKSKA
jgi:non-heme Fe2+,alpha-ketoglutarate-dependent halogenase